MELQSKYEMIIHDIRQLDTNESLIETLKKVLKNHTTYLERFNTQTVQDIILNWTSDEAELYKVAEIANQGFDDLTKSLISPF